MHLLQIIFFLFMMLLEFSNAMNTLRRNEIGVGGSSSSAGSSLRRPTATVANGNSLRHQNAVQSTLGRHGASTSLRRRPNKPGANTLDKSKSVARQVRFAPNSNLSNNNASSHKKRSDTPHPRHGGFLWRANDEENQNDEPIYYQNLKKTKFDENVEQTGSTLRKSKTEDAKFFDKNKFDGNKMSSIGNEEKSQLDNLNKLNGSSLRRKGKYLSDNDDTIKNDQMLRSLPNESSSIKLGNSLRKLAIKE